MGRMRNAARQPGKRQHSADSGSAPSLPLALAPCELWPLWQRQCASKAWKEFEGQGAAATNTQAINTLQLFGNGGGQI